jgi:formylglycine-generating enzyme required for sulfatase activity
VESAASGDLPAGTTLMRSGIEDTECVVKNTVSVLASIGLLLLTSCGERASFVTEVAVASTETPLPPMTAAIPPTAIPIPPTETPLPPAPTPTPQPTRTPMPVLADGVVTRPNDGMTMVHVPAGEFLMGSSDADAGAAENEKPQHTAYLDAYWIDQTEVTNAQYRRCVEDGACQVPGCWDDSDFNAADQPVVCVRWEDARDDCAWAGARLPTEAEWEKAARGTDARIYPWGNRFDGSKLNYCDRNCAYGWADVDVDDGYAQTAPVGSFPAGASPYGALDMAGNAWEWVADWYEADYYAMAQAENPLGPDTGDYPVLRGGSWLHNRDWARSAYRSFGDPGFGNVPHGFRCCTSSVSSSP